MIEKTKELPVLYESDAKDSITVYLKNTGLDEKNKRIKNEGENIGLVIAELSEEEKRRQTEKLFNSHPNRYSVDRVSSFLDAQLDGEPEMDIKEKEIKTKEEILMYAAAMLYAKNEEFPYDIRLSETMVKTEIADITDMTVTKK